MLLEELRPHSELQAYPKEWMNYFQASEEGLLHPKMK